MKTETAAHTPTPWKLNGNGAGSESCKDRGNLFTCNVIARTYISKDQNAENAAFIVHAVNAHEELLDGLRMALGAFDALARLGADKHLAGFQRVKQKIEQAIAKASGRAPSGGKD